MRAVAALRSLGLGLVVVSLAAVSGRAGTVIDFSLAPSSFTSYTESGVTFSAVGGGTIITSITPNGTIGLLEDSGPRQEIKAVIAGGATSVSVDLGDYNADADLLFLEVYNASDVLIGMSTLLIGSSDSVMHTLTQTQAGIAYAIFGSRSPSVNGSSVYADNFTFDAGAAVPEPSTIAGGLIAGVFGLVVARRRRSA